MTLNHSSPITNLQGFSGEGSAQIPPHPPEQREDAVRRIAGLLEIKSPGQCRLLTGSDSRTLQQGTQLLPGLICCCLGGGTATNRTDPQTRHGSLWDPALHSATC